MFKYYMRTKKLKVICARVTFEIRRQPHRVKCEIRYASEHTKPEAHRSTFSRISSATVLSGLRHHTRHRPLTEKKEKK